MPLSSQIFLNTLLAASLLFTSCSKFEDEDATAIVGKWKWVETVVEFRNSNGDLLGLDTLPATWEVELEFRKNGTLRVFQNGGQEEKKRLEDISSVFLPIGHPTLLDCYSTLVTYKDDEYDWELFNIQEVYLCPNGDQMFERKYPYNSDCEIDRTFRNYYMRID